jgi:hypothetical protein
MFCAGDEAGAAAESTSAIRSETADVALTKDCSIEESTNS